MPSVVVIDGQSLSLDDVVAVAVRGARVELAPAARARMERANQVVADLVARNAVAYGVTTGFGKLSDVAIPRDRLDELQVNLVRSHAAGVGPLLSERETRAMMLLRANVIARGYSGARPVLVDTLLALLNAGLYPPIPEQGSVGASGDLAPLAHLALSLIGEGDLLFAGERSPATTRMAAARIAPVRLGP